MKWINITAAFLLFCKLVMATGPEKDLPNRNNGSFKVGEYLKFRVHYGIIDAGEATLEIKDEGRKFNNRPTYHIIGNGRTKGAFDWFFKIRDRYESYLDQKAIVPWFHIRDVKEGSFKFFETNIFNHYKNSVVNEKGTFQVPDGVQDLLTSYYYTRCAYTPSIKVGEEIPVQAFFDEKVTPFNVKFIGRETIKSDIGYVRCLKFRPLLLTGRVFKEKEDMTIWVSDDKNYIPVRLEAKLLVGAVKVDLTQYSGLANPFSALVKQ